MPRTVTVKLGGAEFHMPATYRASREIAEVVGDPIRMAMDSAAGKLEWTQEDVVSILYIGAKNAGCMLDRDTIGEAVIDMGLADGGKLAGDYIFAIMSGAPEKPVDAGKKKPPRRPG